ncbi:MAG: PilZ domain-containing protein [Nitrospiraceae bacterium]|nr:MAG: PilZ domain-containing protein [Nitrospiraceae bacterium]
MEKNSNKAPLNAKVVSGGRIFDGTIESVSEDGLEYFITSFIKASGDLIPSKLVNINFQAPTGETLNLNCELMWFLETSPEDKTLLVGMKIIDPPLTYKEILKHLN